MLIRGKKKGSEGLSEAAAEVENVQHNGIILVLLGGGVIRFIVKIFAECTTRKGPTFKSVKDVPPARCIYRDLQL